MGGFALAALVLTCLGLYGMIAYSVVPRTREIGIRMAPGGRAVQLAMGGLLVGTFSAAVLVRLLKTLLFGDQPLDAMTFTAVAFLLTLVAMLASWLPAMRAARIDPMDALREE